jgi:hypothetical protein
MEEATQIAPRRIRNPHSPDKATTAEAGLSGRADGGGSGEITEGDEQGRPAASPLQRQTSSATTAGAPNNTVIAERSGALFATCRSLAAR